MTRAMVTRRQAIKRIGGLAGMATLARYLPGCTDADGVPDHPVLVMMMLENRSYDHVLGARSMLEGKPGDGLKMTFSNPDVNNMPIAPWEPTVDQMCDPDPPHGWGPLHASWNNGKCDGFVQQHQMEHQSQTLIDPMQYLTRKQMPVTYALADAYTVCDRWFCSVMGPTLPNRAYWHTGTSLGIQVNNDVINAFSNGIPVPSIYNLLQDKGVDWAYYYGSIPVVSLIANAGPYAIDLGPSDGTGRVRRFGDVDAKIGQFFSDCANGKLPPVVYIDPAFSINDDHPPTHPINGQALIASVYQALAKSPQWKHVTLVVTYDENGGFFDHVSPPTTVDDTNEKYGVPGFEQMGFRVPTLVIGPYVKQGYINSTVYDHTSALRHIQNTFGLADLNARTSAANDLLDCIDMDRMAAGDASEPIDLPVINEADWPMAAECNSGTGFRYADPITAWADAHPDKIRGDLRQEMPQYLDTIRNYLRGQGLLR
jgi:phospholipase C